MWRVLIMKKLLMNVSVYLNEGEQFFDVDKYKFFSTPVSVIKAKDIRRHLQNAHVEFIGDQADSILFKGGITGNKKKPRKRKLIEDILHIGSLLGGTNWVFQSRMNYQYPSSPVISHPYLENVGLQGKDKIEEYFKAALRSIKNTDWQKQYENGFHLRMLLNHANITNTESRFLSNVVIWEWLYLHITNPNRADKKYKLNNILNGVMKHFWPVMSFDGQNIFCVLRNQLAHSGQLPINRDYAEDWMKELNFNDDYNNVGIEQYLSFFDRLTQMIVLKTLDVNAEIIAQNELSNFLNTGRLDNDVN